MNRFLAALATLSLLLLVWTPAVLAADPGPADTGRVLISTGGDVTLPAGEQVDLVLVVGGTASIDGDVNTVVAIDGAVVVTGAQVETIVAVRSPITLAAGSIVLGEVRTLDSTVTRAPDAVVRGAVRDLSLDVAGLGLFIGGAMFLIYVGFAIATITAGLLLAGLASRQVRDAEQVISREPLKAFGAGILGIVATIALIAALLISVIGIPLGIGLLIGLWPLTAFIGYLVAGIWIGEWLLLRLTPATTRRRPYVAAVLGLVVLHLVSVIPLVGAIASLFGYGAVLVLAWRTIRREPEARAEVRTSIGMPAPLAS